MDETTVGDGVLSFGEEWYPDPVGLRTPTARPEAAEVSVRWRVSQIRERGVPGARADGRHTLAGGISAGEVGRVTVLIGVQNTGQRRLLRCCPGTVHVAEIVRFRRLTGNKDQRGSSDCRFQCCYDDVADNARGVRVEGRVESSRSSRGGARGFRSS